MGDENSELDIQGLQKNGEITFNPISEKDEGKGAHECQICGTSEGVEEVELTVFPDGGSEGSIAKADLCQNCMTTRTVVCAKCGDRVLADYTSAVKNHGEEELWCPACIDKSLTEGELYTCEHCGEYTTETTTVNKDQHYNSSEEWCKECVEEHAYLCEHCEEYSDGTHIVHDTDGGSDEFWCSDCIEEAHVCDDCGEYFQGDDMQSDSDHSICPDCYEDRWGRCADCDHLYHIDDLYYADTGPYCEECYREEEDDDEGDSSHSITSYHTHVYWVQHASLAEPANNKLYLGFELESGGLSSECDADDAAEQAMNDCDNLAVCQHDSSIPDYGFELISHPCTLRYHKQAPWKQTFSNMISAGLRSHDISNCGLHVHVTRDFLDEDHWSIVNWFVAKYRNRFEVLARRRNVHFAVFKEYKDPRSYPDEGSLCKENSIYKTDRPSGHYDAVNFSNSSTVEFRMTKGTLKYSTVMATLELFDGLVRFVKQLRVAQILNAGERSPWKAFIQYLEKDQELYKEILEYMESKHVKE